MSEPTTTLIIPKADLPECKVVMIDGEPHVDCGSDWGTWAVKHTERMREVALEYVSAWLCAAEWNSKQAVLERLREKRREDLAGDLAGGRYDQVPASLQEAIDRIIELENTK